MKSYARTVIVAFLAVLLVSACGLASMTPNLVGGTAAGTSAGLQGGTQWGFNVAGTEPCQDLGFPASAKDAPMRLWDAGVSWGQIEPTPDQFDFTHLDARVNCLAQQGFTHIILTLGMTPAWAAPPGAETNYTGGTPYMPTDIAYWRRYVNRVTQHLKGRVEYFETWNEPDSTNFQGPNAAPDTIFYWKGTAAQQEQLSAVAYEEIKRIDPQASVFSPSFGRLGAHFFGKWLDAGGAQYLDCLSFHIYGRNNDPSSIGTITDEFRAVLKAHNLDVPLCVTEISWLITSPDGSKTYVHSQSKIDWLVDETIKEVNDQNFKLVIWYAMKCNFAISYTDSPERFDAVL